MTLNTKANRPMPKNMRASIGYDDGGTYVEWYRWGRYEDDGETTRWYAHPLECRDLVKIAPPRGVRWSKNWPTSKSSLERHETHADNR